MQPIVVVLPAPLGPSRPKNFPGGAVKLTPSTATSSPYFFWRPSTSITGGDSVLRKAVGQD